MFPVRCDCRSSWLVAPFNQLRPICVLECVLVNVSREVDAILRDAHEGRENSIVVGVHDEGRAPIRQPTFQKVRSVNHVHKHYETSMRLGIWRTLFMGAFLANDKRPVANQLLLKLVLSFRLSVQVDLDCVLSAPADFYWSERLNRIPVDPPPDETLRMLDRPDR